MSHDGGGTGLPRKAEILRREHLAIQTQAQLHRFLLAFLLR
jgi:hypothetical protein